MPIRPLKLEEATPEQKAAYARNFLNIELPFDASEDTILSAINAAQPGVQQIFVNEPDSPEEQAATETETVELKREEATGKQAGSLGKGDPRAVIVIPSVETQDGAGSKDVVVGVNGRAWQLKRDHELPVPWRVVVALQNAVANLVTHRNDEGHEGEVVERKANRAPFYFVSKPTDAEIREWDERVGAEFCA